MPEVNVRRDGMGLGPDASQTAHEIPEAAPAEPGLVNDESQMGSRQSPDSK